MTGHFVKLEYEERRRVIYLTKNMMALGDTGSDVNVDAAMYIEKTFCSSSAQYIPISITSSSEDHSLPIESKERISRNHHYCHHHVSLQDDFPLWPQPCYASLLRADQSNRRHCSCTAAGAICKCCPPLETLNLLTKVMGTRCSSAAIHHLPAFAATQSMEVVMQTATRRFQTPTSLTHDACRARALRAILRPRILRAILRPRILKNNSNLSLRSHGPLILPVERHLRRLN